jgi:hypothetical protein
MPRTREGDDLSRVTEVVDSGQADRFDELVAKKMQSDDAFRYQWTYKGPKK